MLVTREAQNEARQERAHPAEDDFERFARGEVEAAEARRIVRHMLAGCPQCLALGRELWVFGNERLVPVPWSRAARPRAARSEAR